jgi:hypothetical protein
MRSSFLDFRAHRAEPLADLSLVTDRPRLGCTAYPHEAAMPLGGDIAVRGQSAVESR